MILGGESGDTHTLSAAILDFLLSGMSLLLDEPLVVFKRPSKSIINRRLVSVCLHALTLWDKAPTLQWAVNYFSLLWRGKKKDEECFFSFWDNPHTSTHTHTNLCKWTWHFQRPYLKVSSWKHSHPTCYILRKQQFSHRPATEGSGIRRQPVCSVDLRREFWELTLFIWTVLWWKWSHQANRWPLGLGCLHSVFTFLPCWWKLLGPASLN